MRNLLALLLIFAAASPLLAQTPEKEPEKKPKRARPAPVISPEVAEDGKVTFRIKAERASEVQLRGQWPEGQAEMKKGDGGVWSVTVGPVDPGVWEYSLRIDGVTMIDPANSAIKPMRSPRTSILHLPGNPALIHDFQKVPHGVVREHTYESKSLGRLRQLAVYTPPGYDKDTAAKFPTLYLQHGSGDNQATWIAHGKAHWILDNLIAAKTAVPMVIVMMDGHAAAERATNTVLFERDLLEDVLPFVEANYRVKRDAGSRGIVGLSMGGGQSLHVGLNHADKFAWVGGFSSAPPKTEAITSALDDPNATNKNLRLLWVACGRDDFLLDRNTSLIETLTEKKIEHQWLLTEGNHSWPVWRIYLAKFLPLLFQGE